MAELTITKEVVDGMDKYILFEVDEKPYVLVKTWNENRVAWSLREGWVYTHPFHHGGKEIAFYQHWPGGKLPKSHWLRKHLPELTGEDSAKLAATMI